MKIGFVCAIALAVAIGPAGRSASQESAPVREIAPTGTLRVGVVVAPLPSAFFVTRDAAGGPQGVTVDLGAELAQKLGVPVEFFVAPNSGEITEAVSAGAIDVAFMPIDDERKKKVDFGPAYYLVESTYLARDGSVIKTLADVDHPQVRVIGIAVPKNRAAALAYASAFLEHAKASGSVRRALDKLGMMEEAVAP